MVPAGFVQFAHHGVGGVGFSTIPAYSSAFVRAGGQDLFEGLDIQNR